MKRGIRCTLILSLAVLQVLVPLNCFVSCAETVQNSVKFNSYDKVIYPYHDAVKNYLTVYPDADVSEYMLKENIDSHKDNVISWKFSGSGLTGYKFELSEKSDYSDAKVYNLAPEENSITLSNLLKSQKYYMRITAITDSGSCSDKGNFSTTSLGPRVLNVGGRYCNFRDMGGYKTLDGYTVRQNLLIRGSSVDNSSEIDSCMLTEEGYKFLNDELGIKLELDFRKNNENCERTYSALSNADYVQIPLNQYDFAFSAEHMELYRQTFQIFADKKNYPIYFHCAGGADRTGTVAIMLLALLDVSYNEIIEDYELTSFSSVGLRDYSMIKSTIEGFARFGGETLHEQVVNYLLAIGVTETEMEQIKTNLLEGYTSDYKEDTSACKIIFNSVLNAKDVPNVMTVKKGQTVLLPTNLPSVKGWSFIGWNESGSGADLYYTPGMPITVNENTQLKGIWSKSDDNGKYGNDGYYALFYSANGGSWDNYGSVYRRSAVHYGLMRSGMEYTFPTDTATLHRDGYRLHTDDSLTTILFYTENGNDKTKKNNGYGEAIAEKNTVFDVTSDEVPYGTNLTVYACWDPIITYDMNDGGKTVADFCDSTKTGGYTILGSGESTKYALSENNYEGLKSIPNEIKIASWNTKKDGSGTKYEIGKEYSITEPITLYAQYVNQFKDVQNGSWYSTSALWCNSKGYITGTSATTFNPNGTLTRAQFVQILAKVDGVNLDSIKYSGKFSDVKDGQWYTKAVQWAVDCGVTGGTGANTFSPDSAVTREQLATFFMAYAKYKKYDTSATVSLAKYTDAKSISSWAVNAVSWAVAEGLISGTSATTVSPKTSATRAQAAVIFKSFVENYVAKQK